MCRRTIIMFSIFFGNIQWTKRNNGVKIRTFCGCVVIRNKHQNHLDRNSIRIIMIHVWFSSRRWKSGKYLARKKNWECFPLNTCAKMYKNIEKWNYSHWSRMHAVKRRSRAFFLELALNYEQRLFAATVGLLCQVTFYPKNVSWLSIFFFRPLFSTLFSVLGYFSLCFLVVYVDIITQGQ